MEEKYKLLHMRRNLKKDFEIEVAIYPYANALISELEQWGTYSKLNTIPLHGDIRVNGRYRYSRKDYVMLQMYLHQFCQKEFGRDIKPSYSSKMKSVDLALEKDVKLNGKVPTIADAVQVLIVLCNIVQTANSFTESRAMLQWLNSEQNRKDEYAAMFWSETAKETARKIVQEYNYRRFPILNAFLLLQRCDRSNPSIVLAERVLTAYMDETDAPEKLGKAIALFRAVRDVAMTCYGLQVADFPFLLTIQDDTAMKNFMRERIAKYNDHTDAAQIMKNLNRFLHDTLYDNKAQALWENRMARRLDRTLYAVSHGSTEQVVLQYLDGTLFDTVKKIPCPRADDDRAILKIKVPDGDTARKLADELDSLWYTESGWYVRGREEFFLLARIKRNCPNRTYAALQILRTITRELSAVRRGMEHKTQVIIIKFFLSELLNADKIEIDATITKKDDCILLCRGSAKRRRELTKRINNSETSDRASVHEAQFLYECLEDDKRNDIAYLIPASIKTIGPDQKVNSEFDGLAIFPNRKENQILFLEAKYRRKEAGANKCLLEKFEKQHIDVDEADIQKVGHDCFYWHTIQPGYRNSAT